METWKPLVGWEESYEVSSHGRVRSIARVVARKNGNSLTLSPRIVTPRPNVKGYLQVRLWRNNRPHPVSVHKAVLDAFDRPRNEREQCRHLDGDKTNNQRSNLKWGTNSENTLDRVAHGTHNQSRKTHCPQNHLLVEPNLKRSEILRGKRTCLACSRENGLARYHNRPFDIEKADARYREIMKEKD